jgi:hypothetical protein
MDGDNGDPFGSFSRMWADMAANAMREWQPWSGGAGSTASPDVFRKARTDFLQWWNDWCEQLLRSPAFLDAQKQCLSGNLAVRKQVRANLRQMQRELQLAGREDIDAVVAAVQRSQRRILDRLDETFDRLQSLETKLDGIAVRIEQLSRRKKSAADSAGEAPGQANGEGNGGRRGRRHESND